MCSFQQLLFKKNHLVTFLYTSNSQKFNLVYKYQYKHVKFNDVLTKMLNLTHNSENITCKINAFFHKNKWPYQEIVVDKWLSWKMNTTITYQRLRATTEQRGPHSLSHHGDECYKTSDMSLIGGLQNWLLKMKKKKIISDKFYKKTNLDIKVIPKN